MQTRILCSFEVRNFFLVLQGVSTHPTCPVPTMAKSLRSHSKLAARNRKRYTPDSDYAVTAAARLQQVSERLKQRIHTPKVSEQNGTQEGDSIEEDVIDTKAQHDPSRAEETSSMTTPAQGDMQVEAPAPKKISTSQPRGTRNGQLRGSRSQKMQRHKSRNAGKPKRRR